MNPTFLDFVIAFDPLDLDRAPDVSSSISMIVGATVLVVARCMYESGRPRSLFRWHKGSSDHAHWLLPRSTDELGLWAVTITDPRFP